MTLYPYINLFPIVFLSLIIKSKINLMYITFFFNVLLTFIISFYSSKSYIKSNITSYIFSVIYSLSNIFLLYNLVLGDFGIAYSYTFLPLIIFGFLKIIKKNNSNNWLELSIGMSLILFSHILNTIIVSIFLFLLLIFNIKDLNKVIINNLFKSVTLFIIISGVVWLPFLYFYINNLGSLNLPLASQLYRIPIKTFMSGILGSKTNNTIGFFPLIALFIFPFFYKRFNRYIKRLYLSSLIIIVMVLLFPWKIITSYGIFNLLNQFQMTSRFLIIPLMNLSFIFALVISKFIISVNKKYIMYLLVIMMSLSLQIITGQYMIIKNFSSYPSVGEYLPKDSNSLDASHFLNYHINNTSQFNTLLDNYSGSDNDYIPKKSFNISSYVNKNLGFYNNYHQIKVNNIGYNTFGFVGKYDIHKISLPVYLYNNEKLNVYLNGKLISNYTNDNGLLTIDNINNDIKLNNKVYIKPMIDPFRFIGAILSIVGWIFSLVIFIKRKFRK